MHLRGSDGGDPQHAPRRGSEDEAEQLPRRGESAERPDAAPDVIEGGRERGSAPPGTPPPLTEHERNGRKNAKKR